MSVLFFFFVNCCIFFFFFPSFDVENKFNSNQIKSNQMKAFLGIGTPVISVSIQCERERRYLGHVKRCGVAVVQSDSVEVPRRDLRVLLHVGPQVGAVLGTLAVAQLHAVAPADQLSPQVHVRACRRRKQPTQ